jgi:hypothetical protein
LDEIERIPMMFGEKERSDSLNWKHLGLIHSFRMLYETRPIS